MLVTDSCITICTIGGRRRSLVEWISGICLMRGSEEALACYCCSVDQRFRPCVQIVPRDVLFRNRKPLICSCSCSLSIGNACSFYAAAIRLEPQYSRNISEVRNCKLFCSLGQTFAPSMLNPSTNTILCSLPLNVLYPKLEYQSLIYPAVACVSDSSDWDTIS